jgi:hypothetical protein
MVAANRLVVGNLYYLVKYEDEMLTRPIIASYEYAGREPKDAEGNEYLFKELGSGDQLILRESTLWNMVDMLGLIAQLQRFQATGGGGK